MLFPDKRLDSWKAAGLEDEVAFRWWGVLSLIRVYSLGAGGYAAKDSLPPRLHWKSCISVRLR